MLTGILVDELPLLGLDISLFACVELATLLNDFLRKVFGIASKPLDAFWHHEHLLNRVTLLALFSLLKHS